MTKLFGVGVRETSPETPDWNFFIGPIYPDRTDLLLSRPLSFLTNDGEVIEAGATVVLDEVQGVVMLSQTCDIVRNCRLRPFVEVAPLIEVDELWVEEIRRRASRCRP